VQLVKVEVVGVAVEEVAAAERPVMSRVSCMSRLAVHSLIVFAWRSGVGRVSDVVVPEVDAREPTGERARWNDTLAAPRVGAPP
jgi:hypothetical protein